MTKNTASGLSLQRLSSDRHWSLFWPKALVKKKSNFQPLAGIRVDFLRFFSSLLGLFINSEENEVL